MTQPNRPESPAVSIVYAIGMTLVLLSVVAACTFLLWSRMTQ